MDQTKLDLIKQAQEYAKIIYKNHYRLSGENVYEHALRVSEKLLKSGIKDEKIIVASLLHQTLGTPNIDKELVCNEISNKFGKDVLEIVKNYHELQTTKISHEGTQGLNDKLIIQTYINLVKDLRVLLIRLADKADNIDTAYALSRELGLKMAGRALYLYAPIARLLQLGNLYKDLENGGFKVLHPNKFYTIEQAVKQKLPQLEAFFSENIPAVQELLKENGIESEINYRIKHIYSIYKKVQKYHLKVDKKNPDFSQIYDISAMRIIVETLEDCYKAEDLMNQIWEQQLDFRDDYIKTPKPSGYQSLHNVYKTDNGDFIEVQIKTKQMHEFNEFGLASHVFYKIGDKFKKNLKDNPDFIKEFSNWKQEQEIDESGSKITQFEAKTYAFTPKGDIIEIPAGGCVVDFAYGVHTSVGNSCSGALVNGQIQKLNYVIKTGDTVEIKTSPTRKKPNRDWLDFVKSERAKTNIRKELRLSE
uniref:Bifunctional (P)ppGpp synthetase/guanosine-3',5'-bis(Diphosphate) 3'-pyrophosphohydrolase n=1 Tax=candidate division WWE3 bacterium TaxID=2053526 RepID=A0A7C4XIJ1_UNCKA